MSETSKYFDEQSEEKSERRSFLYQIMLGFLTVCQY
jgi:hypothetical protein